MPTKFPIVEDIPDIESSRVNIKILDPLLYSATQSTQFALRHLNNFKVIPPQRDEKDLIAFLRMQLELFAVTHKSIRALLRKAYREPDKRLISDGASLVREQIEKVFICALVLDNPTKWIKQYMRNALKNDLVEYLVELEEHRENPRLDDLLHTQYPAYLKAGQRPKVPGQKRVTLVSDFAMRAMRHHLEVGGPDPKWFKDAIAKRKKKKRKQELRNYVKDYFDFPTPGVAIRKTKKRKIKPFLYRWYKEYSFVCQYSHVALGKGMISTLAEFKDWKHAELLEQYAQKLSGRILFMSHIATASACAIIAASLVNSYGSKHELREYWEHLYTRALPAKAFWNLYVKEILK